MFTSRAALRRHLGEIHGQGASGTCVCDQCGKLFQTKSNLKIHLLTHSGVKPFKSVSFVLFFPSARIRVNRERAFRNHAASSFLGVQRRNADWVSQRSSACRCICARRTVSAKTTCLRCNVPSRTRLTPIPAASSKIPAGASCRTSRLMVARPHASTNSWIRRASRCCSIPLT